MWIRSDCTYCQEAQALLLQKGAAHEIIIVDGKKEELQEIQTQYNWKTVPVVVETTATGDEFIGGYDDLVTHLERRYA